MNSKVYIYLYFYDTIYHFWAWLWRRLVFSNFSSMFLENIVFDLKKKSLEKEKYLD